MNFETPTISFWFQQFSLCLSFCKYIVFYKGKFYVIAWWPSTTARSSRTQNKNSVCMSIFGHVLGIVVLASINTQTCCWCCGCCFLAKRQLSIFWVKTDSPTYLFYAIVCAYVCTYLRLLVWFGCFRRFS